MESPTNLVSIWSICKAYQCRPSELLGIEGMEGFFLDRAIATWGIGLDAAIDRARESRNTPRQQQMAISMVMKRWVGVGQFR